jgi:MFS family permease
MARDSEGIAVKEVEYISQPRYRASVAWLGLIVLYGGFLGFGCVFHFLPPILPLVIEDLGISHGQAGLLMSLFALPGLVLSFPAGWMVDRFGERVVGSLGLALMGAGTVALARADLFPQILASRTLSGVGAMMAVVALQRMVVRLFEGRPLGLPMGVIGSAVPVGIIIILNTAGPVAATHGWREVAWRTGMATVVVSVGFLVSSWLLLRGQLRAAPAGTAGSAPGLDLRRGYRAILIAGVVWIVANGAMTAFITFAPDHFLDLGLDVRARGLFTSIPMWGGAILGSMTGLLADKRGGRAALIAWGMVIMAVALALADGQLIAPPVVGGLLGIALALVVTPLLSLVGEVLPEAHVGRGFGILSTCANLGIFAVPPLAGWVRDVSGGYTWPFLMMALVSLVGAGAAEILRRGRFTPGWGK